MKKYRGAIIVKIKVVRNIERNGKQLLNGQEIKDIRQRLGMSQEGLASLASVPQYVISQIERGVLPKKLTEETLERLTDTLTSIEGLRRNNVDVRGYNARIDEETYQALIWAVGTLAGQLNERQKFMGVGREDHKLNVVVNFIEKYEETQFGHVK